MDTKSVAVVTGGSRGLGFLPARELAREGCRVAAGIGADGLSTLLSRRPSLACGIPARGLSYWRCHSHNAAQAAVPLIGAGLGALCLAATSLSAFWQSVFRIGVGFFWLFFAFSCHSCLSNC